MSGKAIHILSMPMNHSPEDVKPSVHYQTQTGSWADPSGTGWENGDVVMVYNSTEAKVRLYARANDAWHYIDLT